MAALLFRLSFHEVVPHQISILEHATVSKGDFLLGGNHSYTPSDLFDASMMVCKYFDGKIKLFQSAVVNGCSSIRLRGIESCRAQNRFPFLQ